MERRVRFHLNGKAVEVSADDERMFLWVLRSDLELTGTKFGCGAGLCGSCTVLVDGDAVRACAARFGDVEGKQVRTIEGLARDGQLHPVQEAFLRHNAFQCGFCTPGMILSACALLLRNPNPTDAEIIRHMDDHLCRCGAHDRIVRAIRDAARGGQGARR